MAALTAHRRTPHGLGALALLALALLALAPAGAVAAGPKPFTPWDGSRLLRCEVQDVGTGVDFPDPGADPFCVEFDKTQQNILPNAGLVDFLSKEPARTAAAVPKCFYHQRDHWTGSIVQGSAPELWHWDGNYFFDKAFAIGGVSVRNLRIAGIPIDVSAFAPDALKPYFYADGGGGVILSLGMTGDPRCAARVDTRAERREVYRHPHRYLHGS
jgi:hypothetical protein